MTLQERKAAARRFLERAYNEQDPSAIDAFISQDHVWHDAPGGVAEGREGIRQWAKMTAAGFPDLHFTVEGTVAEGETVVLRWTAEGTHRGPFMGLPPTGRSARIGGVSVYRFAGDRIGEAWTTWDRLGMMQQLGLVPRPAAAKA